MRFRSVRRGGTKSEPTKKNAPVSTDGDESASLADMLGVEDPRLEDRVADNLGKHELTESESLLVGRNFGVATDVETGPNGNLFVVSLTNGAIYEIFRR